MESDCPTPSENQHKNDDKPQEKEQEHKAKEDHPQTKEAEEPRPAYLEQILKERKGSSDGDDGFYERMKARSLPAEQKEQERNGRER